MTKYFEEKEGVKSITRVKTFLALIVALLAVIYSIYTKTVNDNLWLIIALLTYSAGEKVAQKAMEKDVK